MQPDMPRRPAPPLVGRPVHVQSREELQHSRHMFVTGGAPVNAREMQWRVEQSSATTIPVRHVTPIGAEGQVAPVETAPVPAPTPEPVQVAPAVAAVTADALPDADAPVTDAAPELVIERQFAPRRHRPIDMELPGAESPARFGFMKNVPWRQAHRWVVRFSALAAVLVITLGGLFFSQSYLKLHKVFRGTAGTAAALKSNVNPDLLKGEGSGRINILLLGRGGGNHDGPDLTDTMMLASIDPVNHQETLVSIPRDLWVTVPDGGAMKINAAWETGEFNYEGAVKPGSTDPKAIEAGFKSVDQTVQNVLGVNIDYNVLVDFQAFQQAVDTVGGINVDVPTDLVDPTMAWENGGNPVLAKAGPQTFDGKQALIYVRSRETTSDFARAERQRTVLLALKDKVETLGTLSNPVKISDLLNTFGNNVSTDLSLSDADQLYNIVKQVKSTNTTSIDLDGGATSTTATTTGDPSSANPTQISYVATGNMNGQSIVLPKAGLFNYNDIQTYIREELKDPYIMKENAKILILNGTSTAGLATTEETTLKQYGYNVIGVGDTPSADWNQTTLLAVNKKDKYTEHYLEQRFGVTAVNKLSDQSIAAGDADFVIILGNDQASAQQTPAD